MGAKEREYNGHLRQCSRRGAHGIFDLDQRATDPNLIGSHKDAKRTVDLFVFVEYQTRGIRKTQCGTDSQFLGGEIASY